MLSCCGGNDIYGNTENTNFGNITVDELKANSVCSTTVKSTNIQQADSCSADPNYTLAITDPPADGFGKVMVFASGTSNIIRLTSDSTFDFLLNKGIFDEPASAPFAAGDWSINDILLAIEIQLQIALFNLGSVGSINVSLIGGFVNYSFTGTSIDNFVVESTAQVATCANALIGSPILVIVPLVAGNLSYNATNMPTYVVITSPTGTWANYNTAPITVANQIVANDASSYIICNDGGTISSVGDVDFNKAELSNVQAIHADPSQQFEVDKSNVLLVMDTDLAAIYMNSNPRLNIAAGVSSLLAPDIFSSIKALNDTVAMSTATNGPVVYSDATQSFIKNSTEQITLQSGKITNTVPLVVPSGQNVAAPDIQWIDSPNTGLYSSSTGTLNIAASGNAITSFASTGVNFLDHSLNRVTEINGSTVVPLDLNKVNAQLRLDDDSLLVTTNSVGRFIIDNTFSVLTSPDGASGFVVIDDEIFIGTNTDGVAFSALVGATSMNSTSQNITLTSTEATSTVRYVAPSNQTVNLPDYGFIDSTNTGIYSSALGSVDVACLGTQAAHFDNTGITSKHIVAIDAGVNVNSNPLFVSGDGVVIQYIENRALSDANAPYAFIGIANNFILGRANRSGGQPTSLNPGGIVIAISGFVGIFQPTPLASLDISGASGATFKMTDTNQAAGRVMTCNASGVGSWTNPNSIVFTPSKGYCYYEGGVGAGTAIAVAVSGTKYLVNLASTSISLTDFTHNSLSRLTYTGTTTKVFNVTISATISNDTGILAQAFYIWGHKTGSVITGASSRVVTDMLTSSYYPISMSFNVSLATNDYIECYVSNEGNTVDPNFGNLQISIN